MRRWEIENLRERNTNKRLHNRMKIEEAKLQWADRNKNQCYQLRQDLDGMNQKLERSVFEWLQANTVI
jgi:hypothetical protein